MQQAFCINAGAAYEQFQVRNFCIGETVDVYLADLTRLGLIVDSKISEVLLKHAFVAGLPPSVKDKIRTSNHLSTLLLACTVEGARVFCDGLGSQAVVAELKEIVSINLPFLLNLSLIHI